MPLCLRRLDDVMQREREREEKGDGREENIKGIPRFLGHVNPVKRGENQDIKLLFQA